MDFFECHCHCHCHLRAHNNMLQQHDSLVPRLKTEMLIIRNSTSGLFTFDGTYRKLVDVVEEWHSSFAMRPTSLSSVFLVAGDWHQSTSPPSTGERYGIRCPNSSRNSPLECTSFSIRTRSCPCVGVPWPLSQLTSACAWRSSRLGLRATGICGQSNAVLKNLLRSYQGSLHLSTAILLMEETKALKNGFTWIAQELWQRHSYSMPWVGGNGASTWRRGLSSAHVVWSEVIALCGFWGWQL